MPNSNEWLSLYTIARRLQEQDPKITRKRLMHYRRVHAAEHNELFAGKTIEFQGQTLYSPEAISIWQEWQRNGFGECLNELEWLDTRQVAEQLAKKFPWVTPKELEKFRLRFKKEHEEMFGELSFKDSANRFKWMYRADALPIWEEFTRQADAFSGAQSAALKIERTPVETAPPATDIERIAIALEQLVQIFKQSEENNS